MLPVENLSCTHGVPSPSILLSPASFAPSQRVSLDLFWPAFGLFDLSCDKSVRLTGGGDDVGGGVEMRAGWVKDGGDSGWGEENEASAKDGGRTDSIVCGWTCPESLAEAMKISSVTPLIERRLLCLSISVSNSVEQRPSRRFKIW